MHEEPSKQNYSKELQNILSDILEDIYCTLNVSFKLGDNVSITTIQFTVFCPRMSSQLMKKIKSKGFRKDPNHISPHFSPSVQRSSGSALDSLLLHTH